MKRNKLDVNLNGNTISPEDAALLAGSLPSDGYMVEGVVKTQTSADYARVQEALSQMGITGTTPPEGAKS